MKVFSTDLQQRFVSAYDAREGSQEHLPARVALGPKAPPPASHHRLGRPQAARQRTRLGLRPACDTKLRQAARAADATLEDLGHTAGVARRVSVVFRALDRLGITREEKARRADEQGRPGLKAERQAWRREFAAIDPARLVFVDESGTSKAMDRTHGRAPSGGGSTGRCRTATGRSRR